MSLMLIFNQMVRTFPDLQFLKDWHQSSGKKIVHKIRWVEKKSQKSRHPKLQGYFKPSEGNFIMQVVDIRAFSVMFAVLFIPDSWSRIYRGILSLLREIL